MLKIERRQRGWTQAELAAKCGCVSSAIANIESGCRAPSLSLAVMLAGALDLSLAALATSCLAHHLAWRLARGLEAGAAIRAEGGISGDASLDE